MTSEGILSLIYGCCEHTIDQCDDALSEKLTTEDEGDNAEARENLTRARSAALLLRNHLDGAFEFVTGSAEPREADNAAK